MRRRPALWFRVFIWGMVVIDVVNGATGSARPAHDPLAWRLAWDAFGLIGEYAKTITTVPPRKRRQRASAAKKQAFS